MHLGYYAVHLQTAAQSFVVPFLFIAGLVCADGKTPTAFRISDMIFSWICAPMMPINSFYIIYFMLCSEWRLASTITSQAEGQLFCFSKGIIVFITGCNL